MSMTSNHSVRQSGHLKAALIGRDIQLSRSPDMHEAMGRAHQLDYRYDLLDLSLISHTRDDLAHCLTNLEEQGYIGVNVTHPFKTEVIKHIDDMAEEARQIGSVNIVRFSEGRRIGHNSDGLGFKSAFQAQFGEVERESVLLVGAGGAGSAVAFALVDLGVRTLNIFDSKAENLISLKTRLRQCHPDLVVRIYSDLDEALCENHDGIINATPVGMSSYPGSVVPSRHWHDRIWASDIVYFPQQTQFLIDAQRAGCATMSGVGMAIGQAMRSFEILTGHPAQYEPCLRVFDNSVS
jgi:shikimate dehydrogenase